MLKTKTKIALILAILIPIEYSLCDMPVLQVEPTAETVSFLSSPIVFRVSFENKTERVMRMEMPPRCGFYISGDQTAGRARRFGESINPQNAKITKIEDPKSVIPLSSRRSDQEFRLHPGERYSCELHIPTSKQLGRLQPGPWVMGVQYPSHDDTPAKIYKTKSIRLVYTRQSIQTCIEGARNKKLPAHIREHYLRNLPHDGFDLGKWPDMSPAPFVDGRVTAEEKNKLMRSYMDEGLTSHRALALVVWKYKDTPKGWDRTDPAKEPAIQKKLAEFEKLVNDPKNAEHVKKVIAHINKVANGGPARVETSEQVRERLRGRLGVRLHGNEFPEVIAYFKEISSVHIEVNWASLEDANPGIRKVEVTVKLDNVTVEEALKAVLDIAGGKLVQLGYVVDKGIVKIDTQKKLDANADKAKKIENGS